MRRSVCVCREAVRWRFVDNPSQTLKLSVTDLIHHNNEYTIKAFDATDSFSLEIITQSTTVKGHP